MFSSISFWYDYYWFWHAWSVSADHLGCELLFYFIFYPLMMFHGDWVRFLGYWLWVPCVYGHFCEGHCSNRSFISYKLQCILFQKCFKLGLNVWFEFVVWWFKCVLVNLFWHHFLCCDATCCMGLWIFVRMWIHFFINVFSTVLYTLPC